MSVLGQRSFSRRTRPRTGACKEPVFAGWTGRPSASTAFSTAPIFDRSDRRRSARF